MRDVKNKIIRKIGWSELLARCIYLLTITLQLLNHNLSYRNIFLHVSPPKQTRIHLRTINIHGNIGGKCRLHAIIS